MAMQGQTLFHIGSYSQESADRFEVLYINPTTSTRFNPYMPRLIEGLELHTVGGKGGLDAASAAAMQRAGCVYLSFLGGGCTLLSQAVREVLEVGWREMLTHYRVVRLRVEGLGPVTVAIDAHGHSLYADAAQQAQSSSPIVCAEMVLSCAPAHDSIARQGPSCGAIDAVNFPV
jgi:fumarate hydratase subunit beta